jgi:IS5 family transposase/transposase
MLGTRGPQRGLFEADTMYGEYVGRNSFYGFLAAHREELFQDQDFGGMYCRDNGRPSVPPSLLATALVLQTHDRVSDEEAHRRAAFDLQWKVALGVELTAVPFGKSTLCEFRAALLLHQEQAAIFKKSLKLARQRGYLKQQKKLKVALDTTAILGRGAVKDTYNLLADGILLVARALAGHAGETVAVWAEREGYGRYVTAPSLKGTLDIDWDDKAQRQQALAQIVADAERLLEEVRLARGQLVEGSPEDAAVAKAAELLARVLAQDIERKEQGPAVRDGVMRDRMPAIHDPEVRHGRKSKANRFVGHKAQLAVDTDSQLITAVAVAPGNAPDAAHALELVQQTEANTECAVEETIGDCAYGSGATRQAFEEAGRRLVAKVPAMSNQGRYPKTAFTIDLEDGSCTCPAAQVSTDVRGGKQPYFQFAPHVCGVCPLRRRCVRGQGGRTIQLHPQERLLQCARRLQASPPFREYQRRRQVVEHRLARLVQLGLRQARYRGGAKTLFQLLMAAAVANLTLLAGSIHGLLRLLLAQLVLIVAVSRPFGLHLAPSLPLSAQEPAAWTPPTHRSNRRVHDRASRSCGAAPGDGVEFGK